MDLITNNIEPTLPVLHELKLSFEIQQLNVQIFRSPLTLYTIRFTVKQQYRKVNVKPS